MMRFGMMKGVHPAKKIMDFYLEENAEAEYFSSELKKKPVLERRRKGFDGVITALQMQTYLCVRDFRQRKTKGEAYGWPVAVYCTPEHLWGRDHVTSAYAESAASSGEKSQRTCGKSTRLQPGSRYIGWWEYCCAVIDKIVKIEYNNIS
ncbi:MAG: hypothetical protein ACLURV_05175 [Gallintestinimicrobium sp.]